MKDNQGCPLFTNRLRHTLPPPPSPPPCAPRLRKYIQPGEDSFHRDLRRDQGTNKWFPKADDPGLHGLDSDLLRVELLYLFAISHQPWNFVTTQNRAERRWHRRYINSEMQRPRFHCLNYAL